MESYTSRVHAHSQEEDLLHHDEVPAQNQTNVIDMLITSGNYHDLVHNIFQQMFRSLSGRDIHNFRCVSRSWRDVVFAVQELKQAKRKWRKKLLQQWEIGDPQTQTIFKHEAQILKVAVSGPDLFVDVLGQPVINVFDLTTYEFKYSIREEGERSAAGMCIKISYSYSMA